MRTSRSPFVAYLHQNESERESEGKKLAISEAVPWHYSMRLSCSSSFPPLPQCRFDPALGSTIWSADHTRGACRGAKDLRHPGLCSRKLSSFSCFNALVRLMIFVGCFGGVLLSLIRWKGSFFSLGFFGLELFVHGGFEIWGDDWRVRLCRHWYGLLSCCGVSW